MSRRIAGKRMVAGKGMALVLLGGLALILSGCGAVQIGLVEGDGTEANPTELGTAPVTYDTGVGHRLDGRLSRSHYSLTVLPDTTYEIAIRRKEADLDVIVYGDEGFSDELARGTGTTVEDETFEVTSGADTTVLYLQARPIFFDTTFRLEVDRVTN